MTKHIPIIVYEEVRSVYPASAFMEYIGEIPIEWIDNNGINTPYLATTINNKRETE